MTASLTSRELDAVSAWWRTGSVTAASKLLGISEQRTKNLLHMARVRSGASSNAELVQQNWKLLPGAAKSPRRVRYKVDEQYRERQKQAAREGMRRSRAAQAGRREEIYKQLYEAQVGRCAICGRHEDDLILRSGKKRRMAIDHNHQTGTLRGLLCLRCNVMLGNAEDLPERLEQGATYLRNHAQPTSHNHNVAVVLPESVESEDAA